MSHQEPNEKEQEFSYKSLFVPLTTLKAINIIFIVGLIVFGNMLFNDFVWDDKTFIILNPEVHTVNIPFLFEKNVFNDGVYYRPIPAIYSAIMYSISSTNVFFYHFFQLLLHITSSIILYLVFTHFFKKYLALLMALIFLVHPIQVESVSYIAQTVSPLFFLFGILALYFTLKRHNRFSIPIICSLLLLSLLTKETGVLFLFLVLLYFIIYNKREKVKVILGSLAIVFIYLVIRIGIGQVYFSKDLLIAPIAQLSFAERLITIPNVAFYYLKTFLYPDRLAINQHWIVTSHEVANLYIPLAVDILALSALVLGGLYFLKREKNIFKHYLFFAIWFLIGIIFHLQLVPLDMTVADRWFYFPLVGLIGVIGITINSLVINSRLKKIVAVILIIFIAALSMRTMIRNTDWKDAKTLYTHDMLVSSNFELENNLGWELIQEQKYKDAIPHLKSSVKMNPRWERSWYNLGVAYHFSENIPEAKRSYEKALSINGSNVQVTENLAYLVLFYGDPKEAKQILAEALDLYPQRPKLWYFSSLAHYRLGDRAQSLKDIEMAYRLDPSDQNIIQVYTLLQNNSPINFQ